MSKVAGNKKLSDIEAIILPFNPYAWGGEERHFPQPFVLGEDGVLRNRPPRRVRSIAEIEILYRKAIDHSHRICEKKKRVEDSIPKKVQWVAYKGKSYDERVQEYTWYVRKFNRPKEKGYSWNWDYTDDEDVYLPEVAYKLDCLDAAIRNRSSKIGDLVRRLQYEIEKVLFPYDHRQSRPYGINDCAVKINGRLYILRVDGHGIKDTTLQTDVPEFK